MTMGGRQWMHDDGATLTEERDSESKENPLQSDSDRCEFLFRFEGRSMIDAARWAVLLHA